MKKFLSWLAPAAFALAGMAQSPPNATYSNGAGNCGVNGCFPMYYTDTSGVLSSLWVHVASPYSQPDPSNNYVFWGGQPLCQGNWQIHWPSIPVSRTDPGPKFGVLTGSCTGVNAEGFLYTLTYQQNLESKYVLIGSGKGGGGAGAHLFVLNGSFTVTYH